MDVFYWPVDGAKSNCLSVIGTSEKPIDDGFFTSDDRGHKYFMSQPNVYATTDAPPPLITSPPRPLRPRIALPVANFSASNDDAATTKNLTSGDFTLVALQTLNGQVYSLYVAV